MQNVKYMVEVIYEDDLIWREYGAPCEKEAQAKEFANELMQNPLIEISDIRIIKYAPEEIVRWEKVKRWEKRLCAGRRDCALGEGEEVGESIEVPEPLMAWHWIPFYGPRQFQVIRYKDKLCSVEWDYDCSYLVPLYDQENMFATKEKCEEYRGVQHR